MTMKVLPPKAKLLEKSIVEIDEKHIHVTTNTLLVANYFDKRHSNVIRRITSLSKRGLLKIEPSYYLNQQGKRQKYYELNRDEFLLVVLGFTGNSADLFKAKFIQLFNYQEAELSHWNEQALLTADSTKQANDQVHRLKTALAEVIPDSKRCTLLFIHIQQAITKAATGSSKTKRTAMTVSQLFQVEQLEWLLQKEIEQRMNQGIDPEQVRDDVLAMTKKQAKKKPRPPTTKPMIKSHIMCISDINHDNSERKASLNFELDNTYKRF